MCVGEDGKQRGTSQGLVGRDILPEGRGQERLGLWMESSGHAMFARQVERPAGRVARWSNSVGKGMAMWVALGAVCGICSWGEVWV